MAELNFNATLFQPIQPDEEVNEYKVWQELCQRMDNELAIARDLWRESVRERQETYRAMKAHSDRMRKRCKELEARPKPAPPRKEQ